MPTGAPEGPHLTTQALRPMPVIRPARADKALRSSQAERELRRKARLRQRVAMALLVLLVGGAVGVLIGWYARRAPAAPEIAAAPAATLASVPNNGPTAPAKAAPATPTAAPAAAPPAPARTPPTSAPTVAAAAKAGDKMAAQTALAPAGSSGSGVQQMDVPELLRERSSAATGWRLARLRGSPAVMVLEFPNLAEQGAAMNRVAALIEKAGAPRDRVLNDKELAALIANAGDNPQTFYQGHDYVAEHLARFFTLAQAQQQVLGVHEKRLLQLLLDKKVLAQEANRYTAQGLQAIVTFTAPQPDDPNTPQDEAVDERRRESVLLHELSHGLYFTSREYRDHCGKFWRERMTEEERSLMRKLLMGMNYDANNEDLLINEMQALLMHTPDTRAFNARVLGVNESQLKDLRRRFKQGLPAR